MPDIPQTPAVATSDPAPVTRAGAIRFVATFLVLTAIFLTLGRYAVNTAPMNWYLFQVARQTSFMLNVTGDACTIEDVEAHKGRGDAIRTAIDAWHRGEDDAQEKVVVAGEPPSRYDVWRYRAAKLARDLRVEQRYLAMTRPVPRPAIATPEQRIAYLRDCLDSLVASTRRESGDNVTLIMANGLSDIIAAADELLSALEGGARPAAGALEEALRQLESEIERGRAGQESFLRGRVANLTTQIQDRLGPLVMFVARDDPADMRRFNFHLVPDCGALPSMSIYLAALLAFPASWRSRLLGIAFGLPILYAVNLIRLVCLAFIGAYAQSNEVFEFAHQYVWQAVYILIVVGAWLLWVELLVRPGALWGKKPTSAA
ncbi:MAG TPA: archaeosortase/exosortase family protein [Candidatus Hydrogenedentes bacterium]|nr:archaeosortase/exosortase family protein [Candidatus Hydrogenedentota bacterium]